MEENIIFFKFFFFNVFIFISNRIFIIKIYSFSWMMFLKRVTIGNNKWWIFNKILNKIFILCSSVAKSRPVIKDSQNLDVINFIRWNLQLRNWTFDDISSILLMHDTLWFPISIDIFLYFETILLTSI